MDYRMEKKDAFRIVGISAPLSQDLDENFKCVPELWARAAADGTIPRLAALMDGEPKGLLGVCGGKDGSRYYIAVASDAPVLAGMHEWTVPAATWAVFSGQSKQPMAIQELQKRVVTEWLPDSGYEWAQAPDVEVYLSAPGTEEQQFQVWLPIQKARGK